MLRQEINLYKHFEALNTDISIFSRKRLLLAWLGFVVISLIFYVLGQLDIHHLNQKKQQLIIQKNILQKSFFALKGNYPQVFFSQDLETSLTQLETEIKSQEKILAYLKDNDPFSNYLTSLASVIVPNVWLITIDVQNSGDEVTLKGETIDKVAFQNFLAAIHQDSLFDKFKIESQQLGNIGNTNADKYLDFQITMMKKQHE